MADPFEKLDKEMMEALQEVRHQKIPEGLLRNFSTEVQRKIQERNIRPAGIGLGLGIWVILALAFLTFGMVIWKLLPPAPKPKVVPILMPVSQIPAAATPSSSAPPSKITPAPLTESEIISEIEALKELGVWTEEDEAKLGITLEETFSELELALEDNSLPGSAMAAA